MCNHILKIRFNALNLGQSVEREAPGNLTLKQCCFSYFLLYL